jgi:RHS repeat-associated protein
MHQYPVLRQARRLIHHFARRGLMIAGALNAMLLSTGLALSQMPPADDNTVIFTIGALKPVCSNLQANPVTVVVGGQVTLTVACTHSPTSYAWRLNGNLVGTTTAPTFTGNAPLQPGQATFSVVATRQNVASNSLATAVTVIADQPPVVFFSNSYVQPFNYGVQISLVAQATDPDPGDSVSVNFYWGNQVLGAGVKSGALYSLAWTPTQTGVYVVRARATDQLSATTEATTTVIVTAIPAADQLIPSLYTTPAIGTIGGTFAVGDGGAASYTIPIAVPPGTAGMQPGLALTYNSQGGNGLLGVGWSLSGLSVITRCPKTEAQDGTRVAINYDNDLTNDAYCLDGQRLIAVGGPTAVTDTNYSATGTQAYKYEYRTELDGYAKIESYQDQSSTPALLSPYRFRVSTKSGQFMDYGSRWWIISRGFDQRNPQTPRTNVAKQWVLDRVVDRSGNFMEIDYADRDYEAHPNDWNYDRGVLHLPSNCASPPGLLSVGTPIGAYPSVEYWPTAIRYYAHGSVASECGSSPNNQVRFTYQDVPSQVDHATRDRYYDSGAGQTSLSRRLIGIQTSVDGNGLAPGTTVKTYTLGYVSGDSQQTRRSLLESVTECGADGVCLSPSTQFEWAQKDWNATGHNFAVSTVGLPSFIDVNALVGDWNGDGKTDLLGWRIDDLGNGVYAHNLIACLSTGSGFSCGSEAVNPTFSCQNGQPTGSCSGGVELLDVNNDGRVDLLSYNGSGNWTVCLSNGVTCTVAQGPWTTATPNGPTFRGDFDGDGRIDILTYLGNAVYQVCLTRADHFECYQQDVSPPAYPYSSCTTYPGDTVDCESFDGTNVQYQVLIADVNGDGRADLVRRRTDDQGRDDWKDKWKTCFADFGANRSNQFICHDRFVQGPKGNVGNTVVFDFNGDGIADFASTDSNGPAQTAPWRVCLSTGDGAFEFRDTNIHWNGTQYVDSSGNPIDYYNSLRCRIWTGTGASTNQKAIYGDFNGDGRTDIATFYNGLWTVCLSTGSDFACSNWPGPQIANNNPDLNQWVVTGDFNGDGKTDILCLQTGCFGQLASSAGPQTGDIVTKITTGLNATTQISYAPLTDATVYAKAAGADSANRELDLQAPMYVVRQTLASNGIGGVFTSTFFYEGLRGRTDGRGLYGFAKKRMRDDSGIVTEDEYFRVPGVNYLANWPLVGRPSLLRKYVPTTLGYVADITQTSSFNGGTLLFAGNLRLVNRANNTWSLRASSSCNNGNLCGGTPTVQEVQLTQTVAESWEIDGMALPSTTTTTPLASIDPYGNAQQVTVSSSDGYSKATSNTYAAADVTNWLFGRLIRATVTSTKPGAAAVQRTSAFTYHGINGSCVGAVLGYLCDEIIEPDAINDAGSAYSLWQQTSYQYDSYGNRNNSTMSFKERDGTLKNRSSATVFGYNGRFPTTVTNALGQQETRQVDTRFGSLTRLQGPNGIATTSLYDGFGRKYGERILDAFGNRLSEAFSPVESSGLVGLERYRMRTVVSGGGETQVFYDELQRAVRSQTKAFNSGTYAQGTTTYDNLGRKSQVVNPAGAGTITTNYAAYDVLNRLTQETTTGTGQSSTAQYAYAAFTGITVDGQSVGGGRLTTITQSGPNITTRSTTKYVNSQGQTVRVVDAGAGNTDFSFDAYDNLAKTLGPTGIAEQLSYDRRGRKISLSNPDSGSWTYQYNGVGELVLQIDANQQNTLTYYDNLGRMIERREHPGSQATVPFVTVSTYDTYADASACAYGIGKLCEARTATVTRGTIGGFLSNPATQVFVNFDQGGRAYKNLTQIDGRAFATITTFDANGRVDKLAYPSGYVVAHRYTAWSGQFDQLTDWLTGAVHWLATTRYADGQIQGMQVGGVTTSKTYDGFGRVATAQTGASASIQNATYGFDALGNLTNRSDPNTGQASQTFGYDVLNRVIGDGLGSVSYYADGNINAKAGTTYSYVVGSHRLVSGGGNTYGSYDANGNVGQISGGSGTRTLTYTAFNLPSLIVSPSGSVSYVHDGAHSRIKEISQGSASSGTTYYLGGYEEHTRPDSVVEQRHYLRTPEGVIGMLTQRSNAQNDTRYWHKDHLGSVAVITDTAGAVKDKFTYDAWGNRTTLVLATGEPYAEERGYTGHEHLVEVGLTHMNGRIYDPVTGRFLQADPFVQDPWNGQSYDRYGYVLNNPLSFTDPTGFSWWTKWRKPIEAIAVATFAWWAGPYVGAYFGAPAEAGALGAGASEATAANAFSAGAAFGNNATIVAGGFASGGIQGGNLESAVGGALSAGLNLGIGDITSDATGAAIFGNGAFPANVGLHAALGCAQQASAGGSCRAGALSGGFSAFAGPIVRGPMPLQFAAHIVVGGFASRLAGDKFENGAITASFAYLFNSMQHIREAIEAQQSACGRGPTVACAQAQAAVASAQTATGNEQALDHVCPECYVGAYAGAAILRRSYLSAVESLDALVEREMATQAGSVSIVAARNAIKDVFRGPFASLLEGWHQPTAGELFLQKGSWEAVQQGVFHTNEIVNRWFLIWK